MAERKNDDKNKMFIRYENLTAILSDFFPVFGSKQTTRTHTAELMGFFAQADIEKGKKEAIFVFFLRIQDDFVDDFMCMCLCVHAVNKCVKWLAIETDVMT